MKRAVVLAFVACGLLVIGCSSNEPPKTSSTTENSTTGSSPVPPGTTTGSAPPRTDSQTTPDQNSGTSPSATAESKKPDQNGEPPRPELPALDPPNKVDKGGNWTATKVTADQLVAKVSKAVSSLTHALGQAEIVFQNSIGNGSMTAFYKVEDSKTYHLDLPDMAGSPVVNQITANGLVKQTFHDGKYNPPVKLDKRSFYSALTIDQVRDQWVTDFAGMMFRSIFDGVDGWQTLTPAFGDTKAGYSLKIQQRDTLFQGRNKRNYRFFISRTPDVAKSKGTLDMEIVIDGDFFMPVTVRVDAKDAKGAIFKANWSAAWYFKHKFMPKEFDIAPPTQ